MVLLATVMAVPGTAMAQTSAGEGADACERLVETLRQGETTGANLTIEQAEEYRANENTQACQTALSQLDADSNRQAEQSQPERDADGQAEGTDVSVDEGAPTITVQQPPANVTVEQQPATVSVDQGRPEIIIRQPAPVVNVEIPRPEITLLMPEPRISVESSEPQVSIDQSEPKVEIVRPAGDQQNTQVTSDASEPIVRFESEEPQINVSQSGEPTVRMERQASAQGSERQQQARSEQDENADSQEQMGSEQATASQQQRSQQDPKVDSDGQQIAVMQLKGTDLMDAKGEESIGTVAMVIVDAQDRHFIVVDRDDDKIAVHVDYLRAQGGRLMLVESMDESKLPAVSESELNAEAIEELEDDQEVTIKRLG